MNERIKQLDVEAYQWALAESKGGSNTCDPGSDYFLALEKRKFAELLVKECIEQVNASHPLEERSDWGQNTFAEDTIKRRIKEHFGVE